LENSHKLVAIMPILWNCGRWLGVPKTI